MDETLARLARERGITGEMIDAKVKELRDYQRAWQLKELRKAAGMTQAQLAEAMHVAQHRVSQIETGGADRSRIETLRRYAAAIGGTLSVEVTVGDQKYVIA